MLRGSAVRARGGGPAHPHHLPAGAGPGLLRALLRTEEVSMVTIFYTLVISVIIARKYVLRDTGDTTRLKNADTLFDSIDTILSVSQMK